MVDPRLDEIIESVEAIKTTAEAKQDELVSGTNIKTVNNQSVLGSGNLDVGSDITVDSEVDSLSTNPVENSAIYNFVTDLTDSLGTDINDINSKIPAQASDENQLADKGFVNSSIATATATFRGTFETLAALQATDGDKNDYAFYSHKDSVGNTLYDRYKYVGLPETRVPDGYIERLTLNKTGAGISQAYINTGVKISSTDSIYAEIAILNSRYNASYVFGVMDNNENYIRISKTEGFGSFMFQTNNGTANGFNDSYTFEFKGGKVYKNSVFVANVSPSNVDAELYLFGTNNKGVFVNGGDYINIGNFVIYDKNNNKKLDLVPCTRTLDNVNGFYDLVSKQFLAPIDGTFDYYPISTKKWEFEYRLNNSSFTAEQWAAVNSGLVANVTATGFDANATQVLKNINGVIQWVTE